PGAQVRRYYFQRSAARGRPATTAAPTACGFPLRCRIALPCPLSGRRLPGTEMKQTGLGPGVGLYLERVVVVPGDMQASRNSNNGGSAIGLTFLSAGLLLRPV